METTKEKIAAIFELSSLEPKGDDIKEMSEHLEKILKHVEDLNQVSVEGVVPYFEISSKQLPMADDEFSVSENAHECVLSFTEREENFLVVNKFVSKGEEE